jgi:hypothetical protein
VHQSAHHRAQKIEAYLRRGGVRARVDNDPAPLQDAESAGRRVELEAGAGDLHQRRNQGAPFKSLGDGPEGDVDVRRPPVGWGESVFGQVDGRADAQAEGRANDAATAGVAVGAGVHGGLDHSISSSANKNIVATTAGVLHASAR